MNSVKSSCRLFLSHKKLNGNTGKIPVFPDLVFQVTFVSLFYILGQITIERKRGGVCRQLGNVFDFYGFAFRHGRRIRFYRLEHHPVEFGGLQLLCPVFIYFYSGFQSFEQTLFGQRRGKDNINIPERSNFFPQLFFKSSRCFCGLFLSGPIC